MSLYEKLKKYFDETPKKQVLKDWEETKIYDSVNSPSFREFTVLNVGECLLLDNFIINPLDKDNDFEVEIIGDFQNDAHAYLNKEQALKLVKYILDSFNVC